MIHSYHLEPSSPQTCNCETKDASFPWHSEGCPAGVTSPRSETIHDSIRAANIEAGKCPAPMPETDGNHCWAVSFEVASEYLDGWMVSDGWNVCGCRGCGASVRMRKGVSFD